MPGDYKGRFFPICHAGRGMLSIMPHPDGGTLLPAHLRSLAAAGVGVLVSMLSDSEVAELDLAEEGPQAARAGITFFRLPTPDFQVPDREAALALAADLLGRLHTGHGVAVHCWGGAGRAPTLAGAVLVLGGMTPADACARISAARGRPVPETSAQRAFIHSVSHAG